MTCMVYVALRQSQTYVADLRPALVVSVADSVMIEVGQITLKSCTACTQYAACEEANDDREANE